MLKKYSVKKLAALLLPVKSSGKKQRLIEMGNEGDITFEADDATTKLIIDQLFPGEGKGVMTGG